MLPQQGAESPVLPAKVLTTGPSDALRIEQRPLPAKGTTGVVMALNGDPRSLVWLGAYPANCNDAITSQDDDQFIDYSSHYSGYFRHMDEAGNVTQEWPDKTQVIVGTGPPTLYRHIVGQSGTQEVVEMTYADRVATPPNNPYPVIINHASGTTVTIASAGDISVNSPKTIKIVATGNISITSMATCFIEGDTKVNISGHGGTTYRLVDERLISLFNNHDHSGVQTGGGITGPPTSQMSIGAQTTTITYAD